MKIEEVINKVWKFCFNEASKAKDPFGFIVEKEKFGKEEEGGWIIDFIYPAPKGSIEAEKAKYVTFSNLQVISYKAWKLKKQELEGEINNKKFKIIKKPNKDYVGLMLVDGKEAYSYEWQ